MPVLMYPPELEKVVFAKKRISWKISADFYALISKPNQALVISSLLCYFSDIHVTTCNQGLP